MRQIEVRFPKLNHFWLDSGLLGLIVLLKEVNGDVERIVNDSGLALKGSENEIQAVLEKVYNLLINRYYNTSTKKQRNDTSSYNFYYDTRKDKFIPFPKKKSVGIAELIFNKAPRPTGYLIKWEKKEKRESTVEGKRIKKTRGVLPPSHAHLQKKMEEFLDSLGLDVTTSGLLVDGPNAVCPKVTIPRKFSGLGKGECYLCGEDSFALEGIGQTIFPFITGSSGLLNFNTQCSKPEKVCWRCAFVGKFVPVNGFYLRQGNNLFTFFPYSVSLEKMLDVYPVLREAKYDDPNLFKNFQHPLGFEKYADGYFQKTFEVTFAFLYTLYRRVLLQKKAESGIDILDFEKMCNLTISKTPLEFVVLHAEAKGQTLMGKMVWPFRDSVYFFRLAEEIEKCGINTKEVMRLLIDFSQKNENRTLIRNRVCERILKKLSILELIESYIYSADVHFVKPLVDFLYKYEPIIRKGEDMTMDAQEAAVTLGKRIGMTVAENGKKGDLYALRKARRKTDFLNELNRLQFKCNLVVPPDVYEGKLTDSNFAEFKQFCMIAALNSFYAAAQSQKGGVS